MSPVTPKQSMTEPLNESPKEQQENTGMADFLKALKKSSELKWIMGDWYLGDFSIENEVVDELLPRIQHAIQEDPGLVEQLVTVTFHDDGWYESMPFLGYLPNLEQIVLYGNTLLSDLSILAEHPNLRRVAFTNYCCIEPKKGGLDWLNTLPKLEELVFFEGYLELDGWIPAPQTLAKLRSLWMNWRDAQVLPRKALPNLEQLTLYILDFDDFLQKLEDSSQENKGETAENDNLFPFVLFAADAKRQKLRLVFEKQESKELQEKIEQTFKQRLTKETHIEMYWKKQAMPLLNDGYGFIQKD